MEKTFRLTIQKNQAFLIFFLVSFFLACIFLLSTIKSKALNINEEAKNISALCKDQKTWLKCYADSFKDITKTHTADDAIQILLTLQTIDPRTTRCHEIAHVIASTEVGKNYKKWASFIHSLENPDMCVGGFMQGAIETLYQYDPSFTLTPTIVKKTCEVIDKGDREKESESYVSCAHGIGHIMMTETKGNIQKSVALCQSLDLHLQFQCKTGIFMEYITHQNLSLHGFPQKKPISWNLAYDLEHICSQFSADTQRSCWHELAYIYVRLIEPGNAKQAYEFCKRGQTPENIETCYNYSITQLIGAQKYKNVSDLVKYCDPYITNKQKHITCISDTVRKIMAISNNKYQIAHNIVKL